jgi:hypothetical protein
MKKKYLSINNLIILFLILTYSLLWSLKSNLFFSTDFSVYFFGASLLDKNYLLYKLHFDHKGPFLYFFFKILIDFFKLASLSIFISQYLILVIIVFFYLLALNFLANILLKSNFNKFIFFLLSLTSLYEFSIDGIVALLQQTLIIFGYSFLFIFFLKEKKSPEFFYLLIINFFFFLAFLVRVDAIIHLILFNLFIFLYFKNNFYFFLKTILLFILIFSSLSLFFGFTLYEYINSNILFNFFYQARQTNFYLFYRPIIFSYFWITGYFFLFLIIILNLNFAILKKNLVSIYIIIQLLLSYILLWLTKYDKNYLILIILPSTFIFCCYFFEKINIKKNILMKTFLILYLFLISIWSLNSAYFFLKNRDYKIFLVKKGNELDFIYQKFPDVKTTNFFIKNNNINEIYIICSESTDNFLLNIKEPKVTQNGWLYTDPGFNHKYFIDHFDQLKNKSSGFIFFIGKICMAPSRPTTKYFEEIINSSYEFTNEGYLHVRVLK